MNRASFFKFSLLTNNILRTKWYFNIILNELIKKNANLNQDNKGVFFF